MANKVNEVDLYLAALPDDFRLALERVRKAIKEAAPLAEEVMSYGLPTYKYKGSLIHFGAAKAHCAIYGSTVIAGLEEEMAPYITSKGTMRFTPDKPIPLTLIKKMVKARVKENEQKAALKKKK
jgi:uncharacterized protein YdhG (YjbR/CyaY superfamily)